MAGEFIKYNVTLYFFTAVICNTLVMLHFKDYKKRNRETFCD